MAPLEPAPPGARGFTLCLGSGRSPMNLRMIHHTVREAWGGHTAGYQRAGGAQVELHWGRGVYLDLVEVVCVCVYV